MKPTQHLAPAALYPQARRPGLWSLAIAGALTAGAFQITQAAPLAGDGAAPPDSDPQAAPLAPLHEQQRGKREPADQNSPPSPLPPTDPSILKNPPPTGPAVVREPPAGVDPEIDDATGKIDRNTHQRETAPAAPAAPPQPRTAQ